MSSVLFYSSWHPAKRGGDGENVHFVILSERLLGLDPEVVCDVRLIRRLAALRLHPHTDGGSEGAGLRHACAKTQRRWKPEMDWMRTRSPAPIMSNARLPWFGCLFFTVLLGPALTAEVSLWNVYLNSVSACVRRRAAPTVCRASDA